MAGAQRGGRGEVKFEREVRGEQLLGSGRKLEDKYVRLKLYTCLQTRIQFQSDTIVSSHHAIN